MTQSDLESRAMRCLARREYSRSELRARLHQDADSGELDSVLDGLEQAGYLSDRRFVEQILQARLGRYGRHHILHELREKGVDEELIAQYLPEIDASDAEAVRAVWQKKFGRHPQNQKERAQQVRFLQSRGFGFDSILKVIKED